MRITATAWAAYTQQLAKLNKKAGQLMADYIAAHGTGDTDALIAYAHALVTKYGEGSAELACQMYDALAAAAKAGVPAAEPAQPASYGEVARMVQATKGQPAPDAAGSEPLSQARRGRHDPEKTPCGTGPSGPGCPRAIPAPFA